MEMNFAVINASTDTQACINAVAIRDYRSPLHQTKRTCENILGSLDSLGEATSHLKYIQ